jgi:hypothetical protein
MQAFPSKNDHLQRLGEVKWTAVSLTGACLPPTARRSLIKSGAMMQVGER